MAEKSKVLVIGVSALIGKFVVEASAKSGHPTFPLAGRSPPSNIVQGFNSLGVHLVHGDINDPNTLLNAIKQVDVVISTVRLPNQAQYPIVAAIATVGNMKRFLLSVFGNDADRAQAVEPAGTFYAALDTNIALLRRRESIIPTCLVTFLQVGTIRHWHSPGPQLPLEIKS